MHDLIRPETPRDYVAVFAVNRLAFGRDNEARLVDLLRQSSAHIAELALVAETDGRIVGHILFSPIVIRTATVAVPALALAPMAVLPEHQRQGIGSQLVRAGLAASRRLGHERVIVLGHPAYYPRFGFVPASRWGIQPPFPAPDEAFLASALLPGALEGCAGVVEYPPAFASV
jgi:putative acetyltransferase